MSNNYDDDNSEPMRRIREVWVDPCNRPAVIIAFAIVAALVWFVFDLIKWVFLFFINVFGLFFGILLFCLLAYALHRLGIV